MPIDRAGFLKATSAAFFTGGLDVWATPGEIAPARMRVLICADRGDDVPQAADEPPSLFS